ncbi:MAG: MopE-related protein, partial [Candidatus Poseidoniia archaeon]|nr:MopE-related protein [Candidatus Poseidoniia archaeon]
IDDDCDGLVDILDDECAPTGVDAADGGDDDAAGGGDDCDDNAPAVNPGMAEDCGNEIDDDCDDAVDEDDAVDAGTWYTDADTDGYGDPDVSTESCSEPSGYVDNDDDCDDSTSTSRPGADEQCDGEDNDCDGDLDEDCGATGDDDTSELPDDCQCRADGQRSLGGATAAGLLALAALIRRRR